MGPDFCMVQLTEAGVALAKNSPLRVSNGVTSLVFVGSVALKVARYEWTNLLANHHTADGKVLFELVPVPVVAATPAEETHE